MTNRSLFFSHLAQVSPTPPAIEIAKASGVFMYTPEGKKYLDMISGIGVSSIGHCHPEVVAAVQKQAETFMHLMVYGEFIAAPQVQLAKAISDTLPEPLDTVYLVNSGTEATEAAMKLSKKSTGRKQFLSCKHAYHGSTQGALALNGSDEFKKGYEPLVPGIGHIQFGSFEDLDHITNRIAAVVVETVQGEAGVRTASKNWFQALRRRCDETNTLLILDEIQCGFGRTGRFWAFEHYGIVPDIVLMAKAMGGGMPIGGLAASNKLMSAFANNPILGHITTFGGHPVSAAAALAAINIITRDDLARQATRKAALIKKHLKFHPKIKAIRNLGLMMAVEVESFDFLHQVIAAALEKGLLVDWFLYCNNAIRLAPPLTISNDEIQLACQVLIEALDEAGN